MLLRVKILTLFLSISSLISAQSLLLQTIYSPQCFNPLEGEEALICASADWLHAHPLRENTGNWSLVSNYFVKWFENRASFPIALDPTLRTLTDRNPELVLVFMAGYASYMIQHPAQHGDSVAGSFAGLQLLIETYQNNKAYYRRDRKIEQLAEQLDKNQLYGMISLKLEEF